MTGGALGLRKSLTTRLPTHQNKNQQAATTRMVSTNATIGQMTANTESTVEEAVSTVARTGFAIPAVAAVDVTRALVVAS